MSRIGHRTCRPPPIRSVALDTPGCPDGDPAFTPRALDLRGAHRRDSVVYNAEGNDDRGLAVRHHAELSVVPLPDVMVEELRVKLQVWPSVGWPTDRTQLPSELVGERSPIMLVRSA